MCREDKSSEINKTRREKQTLKVKNNKDMQGEKKTRRNKKIPQNGDDDNEDRERDGDRERERDGGRRMRRRRRRKTKKEINRKNRIN